MRMVNILLIDWICRKIERWSIRSRGRKYLPSDCRDFSLIFRLSRNRCSYWPMMSWRFEFGFNWTFFSLVHSILESDIGEDSTSDSGGGGHGLNESSLKTNKKPRKARTAFTDQQLNCLEKSFERQKYLSVQDRMELAARLNLSDTQVKTWYQNRR